MCNTKRQEHIVIPLYAIILKTDKMVKFLEKYYIIRCSSKIHSKPKESNNHDRG